MTYRDALAPWCIIQHLPKMQCVVIAQQFQIQKGYEELAVCGDGEP